MFLVTGADAGWAAAAAAAIVFHCESVMKCTVEEL